MSLELLARRAAELGAPLGAEQLAAFERYRDELRRWNQRVNLTAIVDPEAIELRHFVDSIACLPSLEEHLGSQSPASLIDIGSGAGFPGLPLKLARSAWHLTLVDSVGKKTAFLDHLVQLLDLREVEVVTARAEDLARQPSRREAFDAVVARALAPLPVLLELCLPFLRLGGRLVAPRHGDLVAEQNEAAAAVKELGGRFLRPSPVDLGPGLSGYGLVVAEKIGPTPDRYPRRSGTPAKRPIGR